MVPIKICFDDIEIRNIERNDFEPLLSCLNGSTEDLAALGRNTRYTYDDILMRYVETLVNSLEYFCGIYYNGKVIGLIKGRIETKGSVGEVWFLSIIIDSRFRGQGIGGKIIDEFEKYFLNNFTIENFSVMVMENNSGALAFWIKKGYSLIRRTKPINASCDSGMLILNKIRRKI